MKENAVTNESNADAVREAVRKGYATIAETGVWSGVESKSGGCCGGGGCCGTGGDATMTAQDVVNAIGYAQRDVAGLPEGANMGLSCGNPTALAALRQGETVLDLGSGGGLDCFVAGPKVGAGGRVIGVDMTPEMLSKARAGLEHYRAHSGLDNVEFRLGEIEHLPVADGSVDVVISNCVLNLSPDKAQVWREIARVLKPGRFMGLYVSDSYVKGRPDGFMPIGIELFEIMRRPWASGGAGLQPIDIISVVRGNQKLTQGNWHKPAEEGNFFLRGFNYLFIMRKR